SQLLKDLQGILQQWVAEPALLVEQTELRSCAVTNRMHGGRSVPMPLPDWITARWPLQNHAGKGTEFWLRDVDGRPTPEGVAGEVILAPDQETEAADAINGMPALSTNSIPTEVVAQAVTNGERLKRLGTTDQWGRRFGLNHDAWELEAVLNQHPDVLSA